VTDELRQLNDVLFNVIGGNLGELPDELHLIATGTPKYPKRP
jgi:hypothetical protein